MPQRQDSRTKLLDATLKVVRTKGYTATRIDDVCAEAGVTKGSFFHHFKSKEDLARAAVAHWREHSTRFFADAPYQVASDPLDRLVAYVEFRKAILTGDLPEFTCFAGTIVQEAYRTHPDISSASGEVIFDHAKTLESDIRAAMKKAPSRGKWTARSLALYMQAVIQGGFILAKADGSAAIATECLDHLKRHLECMFARATPSIAPRPRRRSA